MLDASAAKPAISEDQRDKTKGWAVAEKKKLGHGQPAEDLKSIKPHVIIHIKL